MAFPARRSRGGSELPPRRRRRERAPRHAKELAERIRGSRLRLYPDEGHISILDRPIKEIVETLLAP
jgi:pimeloyl-ACP methyl ester carboxylesterase